VASTACRSLGRACAECGGCADRFCAQFFNTRASAAVFFSTTIGLVPGVAGLIVALSNLGSADSCRAGDGLAVTGLALQGWLIGQLVFALAGVATAFYIWAAFQRPFNLRDPRDKNWVARATYLCCYDPGVAVAMVAKIGQVAWLIIGSGMSFHNMRAYGNPHYAPISDVFDDWLTQAVQAEPQERDQLLAAWTQAPHARDCHPPRAEEHLLPLMTVAGAAGNSVGRKVFSDRVMETTLSAFAFSD
jgi:hypothetical protein